VDDKRLVTRDALSPKARSMPVQAAPEPVPEAPPLADATPDVVDTSRGGADGSGRSERGVPLADDRVERADARGAACAVTETSGHVDV